MRSSLDRESRNSRRGTKKSARVSRGRSRTRPLNLETMEARLLLSVTPEFVLDINNTNNLPSNPSFLFAIGSTTYFTADDGVHGRELWKSNGTAASTVLVKDISPGSSSSNINDFTDVNGTLFFTNYNPTTGFQLWRSDGTAGGTIFLKDISGGGDMENVNGTLFFTVYDSTSGHSLWKSDGTVAGTTFISTISPASRGLIQSNLTNVNGTLFFTAYDETTGVELWKSNGTVGGTNRIKDISSGSSGSYPSNLMSVNGTLFFTPNTGDLWKSDGTTAGTVPLGSPSNVSHLININGTLFFSADDGTNGRELWKSNGTVAGTTLVKDIYPGHTRHYFYDYYGNVAGYWDETNSSNPSNLTNVNGTLFFTSGGALWKSNGTEAGTVHLGGSSAEQLTNVNGTLFFTADDGANGRELWKSDGTVGGATLVKDIYPGSHREASCGWSYYGGGCSYWYSPNSSNPSAMTSANGKLFFTVSSYLWQSDGTEAGTFPLRSVVAGNLTNVNGTLYFAGDGGIIGSELWKSDGTVAGTVLVKDVRTDNFSSNPSSGINVNGTVFFTADDGTHGRELWKSDGTAGGTALVKDLNPGSGNSYPAGMMNFNGTLFFTDYSGLWKSDGTDTGTVLVKSAYGAKSLTNVNGTLYFTGFDGLWKSDGTTTGTEVVKLMAAGWLTNVNGTLFFTGYDVNGGELWKSNGTAAGTVMVKDILPGGDSSQPSNLTNVNGTLFFTAYHPSTGIELWKSDGTTAGTTFVKDINPWTTTYKCGPGDKGYTIAHDSYAGNMTNVNGTLFFTAFNGSTWGLWKSNGTSTGTVMVSAGPASRLTYANGTLFFTTSSAATGEELWKSDGTAAGTVLVKDINLGSNSSGINSLTKVNGRLYFTAWDGTTAGLFRSDGTAAGTELVAPAWDATNLTDSNGTLYFSAVDSIHARELWKLVDDSPPTLSISDVSVAEGHAGTQSALMTVTLSAPSTQTVTVNYATANGTATSGGDYQAKSSTLTFAPGETSKTISVLITGDHLPESNETFFVNLTSPTRATIEDGQATGTIVDDEPRVSITDFSKAEGNSNQTTQFTFTVTLSVAFDQPVTMSFKTVDGTAKTGNTDYVAKTGTLTFNPGEITKTITIDVKGDSRRENNEDFYLDLFGLSSNALFTKNRGTGTILNDD